MKEDIELTNILQNYFHNENGELNTTEVNFNELERIEKFYKNSLDKNINIENIKEYQNNYIKLVIKPQTDQIRTERIKQRVERRIEKIKNILEKLNKQKRK